MMDEEGEKQYTWETEYERTWLVSYRFYGLLTCQFLIEYANKMCTHPYTHACTFVSGKPSRRMQKGICRLQPTKMPTKPRGESKEKPVCLWGQYFGTWSSVCNRYLTPPGSRFLYEITKQIRCNVLVGWETFGH